MKLFYLLFLIIIGIRSIAQVAIPADSALFTLHGSLQLSSIGFAPVPSFSFDKPIVTLAFSVSHKRFSYEPAANWGLNARPWIIENWMKYRFISRKKTSLSAGVNLSLFCKTETMTSGEKYIQANRNLTMGTFGNFKLTPETALSVTYWYNQRLDKGTLSGHFIDMATFISGIDISTNLFINMRPEIFYFNNVGKVDGLFASGIISIGYKILPVLVTAQGVGPVWTNFANDGFKWNIGVQCIF